MHKLKITFIIAWSIHFVLLGTYILGHVAGQALANDLIQEQTVITYKVQN